MVQLVKSFPSKYTDLSSNPQNSHKPGALAHTSNPSTSTGGSEVQIREFLVDREPAIWVNEQPGRQGLKEGGTLDLRWKLSSGLLMWKGGGYS